MNLSQTRIVTDDVARLSDFYRKLTGVAPEGDGRYAELHSENVRLAISSKSTIDTYAGGAALANANRSLILDFEVEDVDAERVRIGEFVRDFVLEPTTQPWGNRSMLFRDPDGNLINVYTPVSAGP